MANNEERKTISITHLNIRQSISFMLMKLIVLELLSAFVIIFIVFPLTCIEFPFLTVHGFFTVHNILFITLVIFKLSGMIFIVLQWLNEYYEIRPDKIIHRRGVLFKYEEDYVFAHIMSINLQQSPLGEFFNYGTINMYDRYINKQVYLYLIHNPRKYFKVLKELVPTTDTEQEVFRSSSLEDNGES